MLVSRQESVLKAILLIRLGQDVKHESGRCMA